MAKKLVYNYTFDASAQTIKITGLYTLRTLILITNVTDGAIIYNFADPASGGTVSYDSANDETTITLEYNTTSMSDSDELQILADDGGDTKIEAGESLLDPVHKFRVSNPQNLIDTDFEYGLQPTKWETIELVDNIPSVYTRDSGVSIGGISNINTTTNSETVEVTCIAPHDLSTGDPIEVQGTSSRTANGKYIVTKIISTTKFAYRASAIQSTTGNIKTAYTTIIPGSFFDGSDIKFNPNRGIETDAADPSSLIIETDYVHGISTNTSVYLTNTIGKRTLGISSTTDTAPDGDPYVNPTNNSFYISGHDLTSDQIVYVSADTTTNPSATLPSALAGGVIQPFGQDTINSVYEATKIPVESAVALLDAANSKGNILLYSYNNSYDNLYAYYNYGYTRVISGWTHQIFYGEYNSYYQSMIVFGDPYALATYRWYPSGEGTNVLYTGQPVDLGQYFVKTNDYSNDSSMPATLSQKIWFQSTPWAHNTVTDYIVQVKQIEDPSTMASASQASDVTFGRYVDTRSHYSKRHLSNRAYANDYANDYYFSNFGSGWRMAYGVTIIRAHVASGAGYPSYGYYKLNMIVENTNWDGFRNWWGVRDMTPVKYGSAYSLAPNINNSSGTHYQIEVLIPTKVSNYDVWISSGSIFSTHQVATDIVDEIIDVLTAESFAVGINTVRAVRIDDSRVSFKSLDDKPIAFPDSGSGPLVIQTQAAIGGVDNYYPIVGTSSTTLTISSQSQVNARELEFTNSNVLEIDGEYYINTSNTPEINHNLKDGQKVTFNVLSGTAPTGLTDATVYYARVLDNVNFYLCGSIEDWDGGVNAITSSGSGSFKIEIYSASGRIVGLGTVTTTTGSQVVVGENTKFRSTYKVGDELILVSAGATINSFSENQIESIVSDTSLTVLNPIGFTTTGAPYFVDTKINVRADGTFLHRPFDGGVEITAGTSPDSNIVRQTRKYFRYQSGKGIQCSMAINFNPSRPVRSASGSGTAITMTTEYPHGLTAGDTVKISGAEEHTSYTPSTASYNSTTGYLTLTINNHGFLEGEYITLAENSITFTCDKDSNATNHPYPRSSDPAGRNARLKIISVTTNTLVVDVGTSTYAGNHTFVSAATDAVTHIDTSNAYNGSYEITSATTFNFSYTSSTSVVSTDPKGFIQYAIDGYSNAGIRAGLFDFQNGFFFEYDGKYLYAVRRTSVQQMSGTVNVTTGTNVIIGTNTKFQNQLEVGERIVIRGQTYKVTNIESDTEIHVQPYYRGVSNSGVIVTKTEDVKVPQHNWNIDKADGTGPSGYILDINTIQMVYLDYSWYGAGKIRFGFKDTYGHVKYMHEFIHNNRLNEAYMRSGNIPARYEAFNQGIPTYVPSLFHWGTSVIMDGGFDDDDSYLFTASGNQLTFTNGDADSATTTSSSELYSTGKRWNKNYYVKLSFASANASKFSTGIPLYTTNGELSGEVVEFTQFGTNSVDVFIFVGTGFYPPATYPELLTGTVVYIGAPSSGGGASDVDLTSLIPLISIRLAPSADNNLIGSLGERDIINRMQLKLRELGISVSHEVNISVILNGSLSNLTYSNVGTPSLSQYIAHSSGDTIEDGVTIYQFRASGGSTDITGKRLVASNAFDLSQLTDLGNSILGGDGVFPNGPDIITICASVIDTSEIDSSSSFQVQSRLSWAESQA